MTRRPAILALVLALAIGGCTVAATAPPTASPQTVFSPMPSPAAPSTAIGPSDPAMTPGPVLGLKVWLAALAARATSTVKVTTIGDSITAGWGSSDPAHWWTAVLLASLDARYGPRFGLTNDGVAGGQVTTFLNGSAVAAIPADTALVVIELGINSAGHSVGAAAFEASLKALIDQVADVTDASILVVGSYDIAADDSVWPDYLDAMVVAAATKGVCYLSVAPEFAAGGMISGDGVHPNDAGHALIASRIYELLSAPEAASVGRRPRIRAGS